MRIPKLAYSVFRNLVKAQIIFITFTLSILAIAGCTRHVNIFFQAANDLNNGGNPVVVRLFQLKTDVSFNSETSESFWRNRQISFQRDVVGEPKEIILHPREILKLEKIEIHKEVRFLGVVADFYKPDKDQWKYIYDVSKYKSNKILVAVRRNSIVITEVDD